MRPFKRYQRLQEEIQRVVAEALEFEARDPRLSDVTVVRVRLSDDLRRAKIYFSSMKDPEGAFEALNHAKGFLRTKVARGIRSKYTPEISFHLEEDEGEGDE
jgi:ribosome-binding factor A